MVYERRYNTQPKKNSLKNLFHLDEKVAEKVLHSVRNKILFQLFICSYFKYNLKVDTSLR